MKDKLGSQGVSVGGGTVSQPMGYHGASSQHHPESEQRSQSPMGEGRNMFNAVGFPNNQMHQHMNKSSMRLQLGALKRKAKHLEVEIQAREAEIDRLREKTSVKAQQHMRKELRGAYEVLRYLKKKVGGTTYNEEFKVVVRSIREVLDIGPASPDQRRMTMHNIEANNGKAEFVPEKSPTPDVKKKA